MSSAHSKGPGPVLSKTDKARISAAQAAIDNMASEFNASINERISGIADAIKAGDRGKAEAETYSLKSAAGSFGWTMLGTAANFMLHAIEGVGDDKTLGVNDVVLVHLNALRTLSHPAMHGEVPDGQVLVRSLYALLERRGLLPE